MKTHGRIVYPFLGVRYRLITKEFADEQKLGKEYGVLLIGAEGEPAIVAGSPAEKAGLKEGDVIFELNGERIDPDHTLASLLQKYKVEDEVMLKVLREGKELEVKVKLEERK